ncbi:hypothetical protein [Psychromonas sp. SP041]|uniref:hypothetical protein n=1 Tax=Psychromonas sp. SP041 TaxID=1365007 RepID=UPI0010C7CBAA|nr:hypothetical protein [Psychromonas sp. SP041]
MRIIKELILEIMGDMANEFKGQTLSGKEIADLMEGSDEDTIFRVLEELISAKKPLLKKQDGEFIFCGTNEDLKNLDNPDLYEKAEAPKEDAAVYGLNIPENLFSGKKPTNKEGDILSPYAIIAEEFNKGKKIIPEGILIQLTGFDEKLFASITKKMISDGALDVLGTEQFEDFDEPAYKSTPKTSSYLGYTVSPTDIPKASNKVAADESPKKKEVAATTGKTAKKQKEAVSTDIIDIDKALNEYSKAKDFMEFMIISFMKPKEQYSKHGLASELADKLEGKISKFGNLGKGRFASAIDKMAQEEKLSVKNHKKSVRFSLPKSLVVEKEAKKEIKSNKTSELKVSANIDLENKNELTSKPEPEPKAKAKVIQPAISTKEENTPEPIKASADQPSEDKHPKEEAKVIAASNSDIPSADHPAYNLSILVKAAQITGNIDIDSLAKELSSMMSKISNPAKDQSEKIKSLQSRVDKLESIGRQLQEA